MIITKKIANSCSKPVACWEAGELRSGCEAAAGRLQGGVLDTKTAGFAQGGFAQGDFKPGRGTLQP